MKQNKLKTKMGSDFMKAASKIAIAAAALLTAGGATLYMRSEAQTMPQQQAPAPIEQKTTQHIESNDTPSVSSGPVMQEAAPQEQEQAPTTAGATAPEEIKFDIVTDAAALANALPYLRPVIQEIWRNDASNVGGVRTQMYISQNALNSDVVILKAEGQMYCGALGCTLFPFVRTPEGYIQTNNFTVEGPVSVSYNNGRPSLHFCGDGERPDPQWEFQNRGFAILKDVQTPQPYACKK